MIQRQKFVWKLTLIFTRSIIWGIASAFSDKLIWKQSLLGSLVKILDKSMTVPFLHSFLAEMLISLLFFGKGSQNLEHPKRRVFLDKIGQRGMTGPLLWNSGWIETFPISGWTLFGTQGVNWLYAALWAPCAKSMFKWCSGAGGCETTFQMDCGSLYL